LAPAEPIAVFQSAEHALDVLRSGVTRHDVFGCPVQAIGEQRGAAQAGRQQALERGMIEIELQMPAVTRRADPGL
jgi:hypothetical protein